jgi:peptidoglycan hydrolase FlgJ
MAINTTGQGNGLTMDLRSLDRLKTATGKDPKSSIKEAAKQLESLFMQELVKSMRATTMDTGMLDNSATEMGTSMLDTQLSQKLSGLPGGLSELIEKQLSRQMGAPDKSFENQGEAAKRAQALTADGKRLSHTEAFVRKHQDAAKAAEAATGIPASNILGQAALESGWGKHEIRTKDGGSSHNLFGIKATSDWKGKVAEVTTTEYIGGVPRKVTAKFRAYDSYAEAFTDHARLLTKSPRYSQTVAQADTARGYAQGLQKAGYATDPAYADKLTKVINTTLRLQRSLT